MLRYHDADEDGSDMNESDSEREGTPDGRKPDIFDDLSETEDYDSDSSDGRELDSDDVEELGDIIQSKIDRVVDSNRDIYDEKVAQYVENGMSVPLAQDKANDEMIKYNRDKWLDLYTNILITTESMKQNEVHKAVRNCIKRYVDKDYGIIEAIKSAVNKRKFGFDKLIRPYDSEEEEDMSDDGQTQP